MRDVILFFASLAGAAILTALAVIVSPQSPLWQAILYGGAYVLLVCAILLFLDWLHPLRDRARVISLIGMVIFGLGFVGCGALYFWPSPAVAIKKDDIAPTVTQSPDDSHRPKLLWECEFMAMPNTIPSGGKINSVQASLNQDGTMQIGFGSQSGQPGAPSGYDKLDVNLFTQRCSLTNFGNDTIFSVLIDIGATFIELPHYLDVQENKIIATGSTKFLLSSLDRGRGDPFVVYLFSNNRKYAVQFTLPMTVSYITEQDGPRMEVKLLPSTNTVSVFPPQPKT
jgi:hypothetical protein